MKISIADLLKTNDKPTKSVSILTLSADEALDFLMKSEHYHGFELPEYFVFDDVLQYVRQTIADKDYAECLNSAPEDSDNVNLDIILNKDGKYGIRPLVLANPFLYYFLVRELCNHANWENIKKCFNTFDVPHISACSIPVVPQKAEAFFRSATILNWWNTMEQRSVELSLEYRYMFITDITNCYGCINPQSVEWALTYKHTQHEDSTNRQLAQKIQKYLFAFSKGHNIGIPQGSTLFDMIGEIILGYADLLLHEALGKENISGYEVLRYRDDYRIFCNDKNTLERISYILQGVLETLNFRMNPQKTRISDSIITDAIKPDKLFYIYNTPVFNKKGCDFDGIQKHLLYILMFARQYPNSGQIKVMLTDLEKRIDKRLKPRKITVEKIDLWSEDSKEKEKKSENEKTEYTVKGKIHENIHAIVAIAVQIAYENVTTSHYALRMVSKIIDSLDEDDKKQEIVNLVYNKLCNQPNSDYNQLWLQNMTHTTDERKGISPYTLHLCRLVNGDFSEPLWNNSWLKTELTSQLPYKSIINQDILSTTGSIITFRETRAYNE